ncbi:MAG: chromosome segregation protein SMC [Candidatus Aminicenantes bacterium]
MIIKKLELQGFKSFPDKTKLKFHPGITAIIGPNGTGKSNIVDALLWVLRGGRLKALRGDRSGDVIFNGNEQKASMGMADVNLFLASDEKELKINHRVFRSGESEYRMDGKRVRLKDIQDTLWKNSIGETDYFVIEQGSIGAFLSSKPVEKRSLLEEAAGTAFFKEKKRQAENKLENTEQNLLRLEDIINEVSKAKNSLQRQARAAKRFRKLREKTRGLNLMLFRIKLHDLQKEMEELNQPYQEHLSEEKAFTNRLKTEEKELAEIRRQVWTSEKNLNEDKENLYSLKSRISNLRSDQERESKRIDYFQEKKKRSQQELTEIQQEIETLTRNREEYEQILQDHQKQLNQDKDRLEKAKKSNQTYLEKLNENEKTIEQLRDQYYQKISSHTELKNNEAKLDKEIELISKQEEKIESELESENNRFLKTEKEIKSQREKITHIQKEVEEQTKLLKEHQEALKKEIQSIQELEQQITDLEKTRSENSHHLNALQKLKQKEQSFHHTDELKNSYQLLADVVDTDEENAKLIDVFYKEEAKSLLMKPEDFIDQLSRGQLKGNFLLLHPEQKTQDHKKIQNQPKVIGLLKNRIKAKSGNKDFRSYLPEAVIVQSLQDAVHLWVKYPEYHFITLKGDVLLSSGFIKSGEKKEGLFALTREIKAVSQKIIEIDNQMNPLRARIEEHKKNREKLIQDIQQTESNISHRNQEKESLKKDLSYGQEQKETIRSRIELIKNEKKELSDEKAEMTKEKDQLSLQGKKANDEINSIKTAIKQEQKKYENLQNKKEQENKDYFEIKTQIDVLYEKNQNLDSKNKETEERINTLNKKLKSLEQDIRESEKEKELLKRKISDIKQTLKELEHTKVEKESTLTQGEEKLHEIQKQLSSKEEQIQELREKFEQAKENRIKWEIKKAEKERDLINCEESCWQELKKTPEEVEKETPLPERKREDIEKSLSETQEKLEKIGSVNLMAEEEYNAQKKRYDFLTDQRQDLRDSIQSTKKAIKKIDSESKSQFLTALVQVNKNFQDIFSILFNGGSAQIKLSDEEDPLESGLDIEAQPPGKKVKNLTLLSGGEKALTSLAFFFALFRYKPAPFCILDEVDAALDETNLTRFLNLMKEIKNQTQFIIITHNFKTMEVADYIYGTAMPDPNITDIYSVRLEEKQLIRDSERGE